MSCAPTAFVSPSISLDLNIQSSESDQQSNLVAASLEVDGDELATLSPKAFHVSELCLVVSATGSGITRDFADTSANSCDNAFPGVGQLSQVFKLGEQPEIDVTHGQRRFDLIGFYKSYFGESCPSKIEVQNSGTAAAKLNVDGKVFDFPTGANTPISLASTVHQLQPGKNSIGLQVKKSQSTFIVGMQFGCRNFQIFPTPNVQGFVDTGIKEMFFDVECPLDASHIKVSSSGGAVSALAECSTSTGRAVVKQFAMTSDEITASAYGWYYPQVNVSAYAGSVKVDSRKMKVKIDDNSLYKPLSTMVFGDPNARDFSIPINDPNDKFLLESVNADKVVFYGSEIANKDYTRYEVGLNQDTLWDGDAPVAIADTSTKIFDSSVIKKSGYFVSLDGAGKIAIQKCLGTSDCSTDWAGVLSDRSPASIPTAEIFGTANQIKILSVVQSGGSVIAELLRSSSQSWMPEGYAEADKEVWADENHFYPAWQDADVAFVKTLNFVDPRLAESYQSRTHILLAGTQQVEGKASRQTVIYRSPDSGRNWYLVYKGLENSKPLDALSFANASGNPGFAILESVDSSLRILLQDTHTWGF